MNPMNKTAECSISGCKQLHSPGSMYCAKHKGMFTPEAMKEQEQRELAQVVGDFKKVGDLPAYTRLADVATPSVSIDEAGTMFVTIPRSVIAPTQAQDPVVEANRKMLLERSQLGIQKYGTTLAGNKLTRKQWLQHALEEALDLANYLQAEIMREEDQESDDPRLTKK